jgi:hypothetical protein
MNNLNEENKTNTCSNNPVTNVIDIYSKCINVLTDQIDKYKNNEYMLQRIYNHTVLYLPNTLVNEFQNHEKRVSRTNYLINEQHTFIQVFLSNNKYFYLSNNNFYYEYDGEKYLIVKEDDIIHKLLSTISNDRVLLEWKHKTKLNIIKKIKERSLFTSIPETYTIQNVLNVIYPFIFVSKNSAKYFLTVIGDNILKKNPTNVYLISQKTKQLLNELDSVAIASIGNNNITNNFMTKYHESHCYENCRLIKINETFSNKMWRELLKTIGLDLLCLAVHYSKRYENGDSFIMNNSDEELKSYTYYLRYSYPNKIVNEFCDKYIIKVDDCFLDNNECKIEWKSLHFVWKQFLSSSNLLNVIYSNTLKNLLKEKYTYDEASDSFLGITSKHVPIHQDFISFWENTITLHNKGTEPSFYHEFEIDELCSLFKLWKKNTAKTINTNGNISEENILKILKHFFHEVEVIEDKYVLNITSSAWNKINDITNSFPYIKERALINDTNNSSLISFDDAYNYYYKYCNMNSLKFIVSKIYFEKYLYYKIHDGVVYDKFIEIHSI